MTLNPDLMQSRCAEIEDSHNRLEEIRSVHFDECGTERPDPQPRPPTYDPETSNSATLRTQGMVPLISSS